MFRTRHQRLKHREAENSFNLHFQETFFVSKEVEEIRALSNFVFQSPFSGDFLCFIGTEGYCDCLKNAFQSPFSGDFLCFWRKQRMRQAKKLRLSISIFRRLSLFLPKGVDMSRYGYDLSISIFRRLSLFQRTGCDRCSKHSVLSISIFRRLSLFP